MPESDKAEKQSDNSLSLNGKRGRAAHLTEHQFQPGESGNPGGRPKGKSISAEFRKLMDRGLNGKDLAEAMAKRAYEMALKGNFQFFNMIMERTEGKVPDQMQGDFKHHITVDYAKPELPRG